MGVIDHVGLETRPVVELTISRWQISPYTDCSKSSSALGHCMVLECSLCPACIVSDNNGLALKLIESPLHEVPATGLCFVNWDVVDDGIALGEEGVYYIPIIFSGQTVGRPMDLCAIVVKECSPGVYRRIGLIYCSVSCSGWPRDRSEHRSVTLT
jgi:hypothetical protein